MAEPTPQRLIDGMRGVRYGEVLAMFLRDTGLEAEVFGTQMLNDCPQALWDALDADAIAKDMGAVFVKLNGPRYWLLDGLGSKVAVVEPVFKDFNGIQMRRIATIPLGADFAAGEYVVRNVNRGAVFFFDAGKTVYELVDPEGRAFVMQARCVGVDPGMTEESLANLGERLALPEGWSYRTRVLDSELVIDTSATLATVVQDEFENTYTLPY
ncbi:MAG: hypothetical protein O2859_07640 [Actinomycetota bacterium]|jgi:hypothetical protein|nr:hypothetical protein [Actinomycetota bacterium]MDA2999848.1 hypothetical protein [Actinomycetota bacterium]